MHNPKTNASKITRLENGDLKASVAGVSFVNDDGTSRQAAIEQTKAYLDGDSKVPVFIEKEPTNKWDKNAIKVFVEVEGKKLQVGYIAKGINVEILRVWDSIDGGIVLSAGKSSRNSLWGMYIRLISKEDSK